MILILSHLCLLNVSVGLCLEGIWKGEAQGTCPLHTAMEFLEPFWKTRAEAKGWMAHFKVKVTNQQRNVIPIRQRGITLWGSIW